MTAPSKRPGVTARSFFSRARITAIMLVGLGGLAGCTITGVDTGATPPSGPTGVGVGGGGSHGGGGGSGGSNYSGTYTLVTANDSTLPVRFTYDSVSGPDTTVVFAASFDSSHISLNTDNTANENDFLTFYELRTSTIPGDSSYNRTITVSSLTSGTYAVSGTTLTITRTDTANGGAVDVTTYTLGIHTFNGVVSYTVYNSAGLPVSGVVALVYNLTGSPYRSVLRPGTTGPERQSMGRARLQLGRPALVEERRRLMSSH